MKKRLLIIVAALLAAGVLFLAVSTYARTQGFKQMADMSFAEMMAYTSEEPGSLISVGIVRGDQREMTLYGQGGSVLPLDTTLEYEIGSLTKTFTTSLLCKALADGRAALSDSAADYLDMLPDTLTLERLATHTAGYKAYHLNGTMVRNQFRNTGGNDFYAIDTEALLRQAQDIKLEDRDYPFVYSNFGLSLLGAILAAIYEQTYPELMGGYVAELGLSATRLADGTGNMDGYWRFEPDDAILAAGGLVSTIGDMLRYTELQLSEKLPYLQAAYVPRAEIESTAAIQRLASVGLRQDAVGLGWMLDDEGIVWHNGATSEFNSYLGFDRERQIGVVILSNLPPDYRIPATIMGPRLLEELRTSP